MFKGLIHKKLSLSEVTVKWNLWAQIQNAGPQLFLLLQPNPGDGKTVLMHQINFLGTRKISQLN